MRPPLNSKRKLGVHKNEARRNVFRARHRVIRDFFLASLTSLTDQIVLEWQESVDLPSTTLLKDMSTMKKVSLRTYRELYRQTYGFLLL